MPPAPSGSSPPIRGALVHPRPQAPDFEALTRDRLTGALGWHYFRMRLVEELDRAGRYTRALSLLLVDLDDSARPQRPPRPRRRRLRAHAGRGTLVAGARSVDFVGRWAGGGFALLLPETAVGAAYGLAERLRADLAARRLPAPPALLHPSRQLRVTVSCGVASLYKDGTAPPARSSPAPTTRCGAPSSAGATARSSTERGAASLISAAPACHAVAGAYFGSGVLGSS